MSAEISGNVLKQIITAQKNEITEYHIYKKLAWMQKDAANSEILLQIANDELEHYKFWKTITNKNVKPSYWNIFIYTLIARLFGLTFGIKLMEKGEENAQINYNEIAKDIPEAKRISEEEEEHEKKLISFIREESLKYIGSVVLGLNDALVELTGALAGLSFALQNTRLIAIVGLITGIAASFSMAASEYLSTKSEADDNEDSPDPLKSSIYTGIAYIITVALLIIPYFIFSHYLVCLGLTLFVALFIIFIFNYYIAVAKDLSFKRRFFEMAFLSLGVAGLSFVIGFFVRKTLGVDV